MPTTRSIRTLSSLVGTATSPAKPLLSRSPKQTKRKPEDADAPDSSLSAQSTKKPRVEPSSTSIILTLPSPEVNQLLPATLNFSFETAKQHLINADARFESVFNKLPCGPFEQLETVDPFRTLATSILGQHTHMFIRLYHPFLSERPPPVGIGDPKVPQDVFPTASQVADTDIMTLKSAGLSTRRAEYVQDLASHFADGRLTNQRLTEANDEELARLLIQVRGIGKWTVDMFALFSLRRPDILPHCDPGVQRGVIRWILSLHSPDDPITISPKKLPKARGNVSQEQSAASEGNTKLSSAPRPRSEPNGILKGCSSVDIDIPNSHDLREIVPLPDGITVASLKSRLNGKKIKGALLTPKEMEELTEPWRPYRSLGVYYMWALTEDKSSR